MPDDSASNPTSESAPKVFTQTAESPFPALDDWSQMTEEEANLVYEMTLHNELSGGTKTVRAFEERWRQETGLKYAITTCNGSSALLSAYFGLGVGPGDEVICPTYTWICSIGPALLLGARPVFAESDPKTMLLDPEDVRQRITPRTRAIVAVHLWGNVCDLDALLAISQETGVPIVEDCSHAHGATYNGKPIGTLGRVGAWSLQGSKAVSAGEGGVLATDDVDVFERACIVGQCNRVVGLDLVTSRYAELQPLGIGMKLRSHPLGIGIAGVQLDKLAELNAKRGAYIEEVEAGLAKIPGVEPVRVVDGATRGGYYAFPFHHIPEEHGDVPTAEFIEAIRAQGVPARPSGYGMLHDLPLFAKGFDLFTRDRGPLGADYSGYRRGDLPVTERMHERLVFLPVLSNPAPGAAEFILAAVRKAVDQVRRPVLA